MQRQAWLGAAIAALCALPQAGCGGDTMHVESACTGSSALTYTNFGKKFVDDYCASCHAGSAQGADRQGAPTTVSFDSLAQIQAKSREVENDVVVLKVMPFGQFAKRPSDAQREQFGQWLNCGAPP